MDEHHVDIFHEAGIFFRAGPVLDLAERHGVRGTVELLLPYTVSGPGYQRGVLDALRTALRMLKADRIDEGIHWLGEAVIAVPRYSRTVHRPSDQRQPSPPSARPHDPGGPDADADAATQRAAAYAQKARGPGGARSPSTPHTQPSLFDEAQAPAGTTAAVEVHVYPPQVARVLARSTATPTYPQPEPDAEFRNMHLVGAAPASPDDRWREVLRTGAATGKVTAIAVSDPRQVRPENRLDDQHWQRAASCVAAIVDPRAPWVAFRTRPDAVAVFVATTPEAGPAALPRLAAVATNALYQRGHARGRPPLVGSTSADPFPSHRADTTRPPAAPSPARAPRPRR